MQGQNSPRSRILAAMDLSVTGDHALEEALQLARDGRGELHVVHVISVDKSLHDADQIDELSRALDAKVEALRERMARYERDDEDAALLHDAVLHIRLGDPAAAIHQAAVDIDADFIVVGTHGRSAMEKLVLGSVAEELVRTARIPVVVAHPKDLSSLPKSERPDPLRPGEDLTTTGVSPRLRLSFGPRTTHISGLV